jgi:hypothetical protein
MPRTTALLAFLLLLSSALPAAGQALGTVDLGGIAITPAPSGNRSLTFAITTRSGRTLLEPSFQVLGNTVYVVVSSVDIPLTAPDANYSRVVGPLTPGIYTISYHNVTAPFHYLPTTDNRITTQTAYISDDDPLAIPGNSILFLGALVAVVGCFGLRAARSGVT